MIRRRLTFVRACRADITRLHILPADLHHTLCGVKMDWQPVRGGVPNAFQEAMVCSVCLQRRSEVGWEMVGH